MKKLIGKTLEKDKLKKIKKSIVGGTAAAGISVSMLLGGLFSSPEELAGKNETSFRRSQNNPVVTMVDTGEADDGEEGDQEDGEEGETGGIFARIKKKILTLPAAVRALVGVPLWAVGWVIIHVLSLVWGAVLAPVLGHLLKWVLGGLALLGVFAAAMKCAFPNLPLKKILRPKNVLFIVLGSVILGVADQVIPLFWNGYHEVRFVIMLGGGLLVLLLVGIPFIIRQNRIQKEEEQKRLEKQDKKTVKYYLENTLLAVKEYPGKNNKPS